MITTEWATREAVADMVLRDADIAELAITCPAVPYSQILADSVDASYYAELVRHDGEPAIVFGVAQTALYGVGAVWMLASPDLSALTGYMARNSRAKVEMLNRMFPVLVNFVHEKNTESVRWLRWCGFEVYPPNENGLCYFRKGVS